MKKAAINRLKQTDERVRAMREVIDGAKVVKLQGWEGPFLTLLDKRRNAELKSLRVFRTVQTLMITLGRASPIIAAAVSFVTAGALGAELAPQIFPALSIFLGMRTPFVVLPATLALTAQARASLKRVERYMGLADQPKPVTLPPSESDDDALLELSDCTLGWKPLSATAPAATAATAARRRHTGGGS